MRHNVYNILSTEQIDLVSDEIPEFIPLIADNIQDKIRRSSIFL